MKGLALSWSVAAALCVTPAFAFRTTADVSTYEGQASRWEAPGVPFYLHQDGAPGLPFDAVERAAVEAWKSWEAPPCSAVNVENWGVQWAPAGPEDGRNTIQWVSDWTARGYDSSAAGATDVAYARTGETWRIVEADIYLNAEHHAWQVDGDEELGRSVQSVLTHEFGHALGLWHPCEPDGADGAPVCDEHPEASGTAMHPEYNPAQVNLAGDDEAGICFLYPSQTCPADGCPAGSICTKQGCAPDCEPACGPGERCQQGVCLDDPGANEGSSCAEAACGAGRFGDPCGSSAECASGVCAEGACAQSCSRASDCETHAAECRGGFCVSELSGLGALCAEADECLGGQCLHIDDDPAVCTRACSGAAQCPADWSCGDVEGRVVCLPPGPLYPSGACALVPVPRSGHKTLFFACGALIALVALRRACR